jgi:hypothetical protein
METVLSSKTLVSTYHAVTTQKTNIDIFTAERSSEEPQGSYSDHVVRRRNDGRKILSTTGH